MIVAVEWWTEGTATGLIVLLASTIVAAGAAGVRFVLRLRDEMARRVGQPNGHGDLSQVSAKTYDEVAALRAQIEDADRAAGVDAQATASYRAGVQAQIDVLVGKVDGLAGCIKNLARQIERDCGGVDDG